MICKASGFLIKYNIAIYSAVIENWCTGANKIISRHISPYNALRDHLALVSHVRRRRLILIELPYKLRQGESLSRRNSEHRKTNSDIRRKKNDANRVGIKKHRECWWFNKNSDGRKTLGSWVLPRDRKPRFASYFVPLIPTLVVAAAQRSQRQQLNSLMYCFVDEDEDPFGDCRRAVKRRILIWRMRKF